MEYEFFAGSYGSIEDENIIKFSLDAETGKIRKIYGYHGLQNPSWLSLNPSGTVLYAVEEVAPEGKIHAFEIEENGLKHKACLSTKGADPCHIGMDEQEKHLFIANYTSGSFIVYQLNEDGIPVYATDFLQATGHGTNLIRQEGSHIHFSKAIREQVYVVDLGTDLVSTYYLDTRTGELECTAKSLCLPNGAGPRHLEFHPEIPNLVYVACELGSSVALFQEKDGRFKLETVVSALPEPYSGENTVAAIRIWDGQLFLSNRGHDSIAVFSLQEDGKPVLQQVASAGGRTPRDFAIFGEYMVVANQDSNEITVLRLNPHTKLLEQTGISVPMTRPSCICVSRTIFQESRNNDCCGLNFVENRQ